MLETFQSLKDSNAIQIAGATPNSDRFRNLLNEATEQLLHRGDFLGTVVPIQVCVKAGCVVMPRYVQNIREAKTCCEGSLYIKNEWYGFTDPGYYNALGYGLSGIGYGYSGARCESFLIAAGQVPTFSTIYGDGRKVRYYAQTNADHGKTITIFGKDNNNQPLMHRVPDTGEWREGWVLTAQNPYAETDGYVRSIDRVVREATQKPTTLWAWNVADSVLEGLATYDPSETNPAYQRYRLNLPTSQNEDGSQRHRSIVALVKLAFQPVRYDTDIVLIGNRTALKYAMQGALAAEGNDDATFARKLTMAIAELNAQLRDNNWLNQTTIAANSVGCPIYSPI